MEDNQIQDLTDPVEEQPQPTQDSQTVVLSDEQFTQLISQSQAIHENQIWLLAALIFIIAGLTIITFFVGWRSSR